MKSSPNTQAFTLVELILVVAIIALLTTMISPTLSRVRQKAQSVACANNLKQIVIAAHSAATDNDDKFPYIEPNPAVETIYEAEYGAVGLHDALKEYGVSMKTLTCPLDASRGEASALQRYGLSYEWRPFVDGESAVLPKLYTRRGVLSPKLSRVCLVSDFEPIHNNWTNRGYADGHTRMGDARPKK